MPDDDEIFVRALADEVASLTPLLEQHVSFHEELLSHVFFGDVSRWATEASYTESLSSDLKKLLEFLEAARRTDDPSTSELIDASFIENICGETDLARQLPPVLANRYRTICTAISSHHSDR